MLKNQSFELASFIKEKCFQTPTEESVIITGDFNIDFFKNRALYGSLIEALSKVSEGHCVDDCYYQIHQKHEVTNGCGHGVLNVNDEEVAQDTKKEKKCLDYIFLIRFFI